MAAPALPPDNSYCFVVGDFNTLLKSDEVLKANGCRVALYFMESIPSMDYSGKIYRGNLHWSDLAWDYMKSKVHLYDFIVFYDGGIENYAVTNHPPLKGKTCTYWLGVDKAYQFSSGSDKSYDFVHFGWVPQGGRRIKILTELAKHINLYPKWSSMQNDRTLAFDKSRYILNLHFHNQPSFPWARLAFAIANKKVLFTEASICKPVYTEPDTLGDIIPGKHFMELPFIKNDGDITTTINLLKAYIKGHDKLEKIAEDNYKYFFENYGMSDRLKCIFNVIYR